MKENLIEINRLYLESNEIYHTIAKKFNLSDSSFWILYCLRISDSCFTQADLMRGLSLSKQTINSSIKLLEEKELICYVLENNLKNKYLKLTSLGEEFCSKTIDKVFMVETSILNKIGLKDVKEILRIQKIYNELLKEELYEN